jgi:hypothetical protein
VTWSRAGHPAVVLHTYQKCPALPIGQADDRLDQIVVGQRGSLLAFEFDGEGLALSQLP